LRREFGAEALNARGGEDHGTNIRKKLDAFFENGKQVVELTVIITA
jgi:hypothetical protein